MGRRDYWNDVYVADPEAVKAEVIAIIQKGAPLNYYEIQQLRNCAELCDRGHFEYTVKDLADKVGEKVPAELAAIMEDADFDVRVSFMKDVVKAVDPAPIKPRFNPRAK